MGSDASQPTEPSDTVAPHSLPADELLRRFSVDSRQGLTAAEVVERRANSGENLLEEAERRPAWKRFLDQFASLVIWILIIAAVVSGALGEWIDAGAILAIVVLNGVMGFLQEARAERALAALQGMSAPTARVRRDGQVVSVPAKDLVPGDCVELEAGDRVPADIRLLESFSLAAQESALTGESVPVEKSAKEVLARDIPLGDRGNMVYMGTVVTNGKAHGLIVGTGMQTELGRIAEMLHGTEREATPLQQQLAHLGRVLVAVCLILVAIVFLLQFWHEPALRQDILQGQWLKALKEPELVEVFLIAVSLAVAAVPEGLPAVVTLALALGLQRMVKRNALVRKLASVETLGAVTVICSDKTGTLTRNEMTVRELLADGQIFQVTGSGYQPEGKLLEADDDRAEPNPDAPGIDAHKIPGLWRLLETAAWCNNARLVKPDDENPTWRVLGDPTEGALVAVVRKAGIDVRKEQDRRQHELPFDSDRKLMSVVVRNESGQSRLYTKGAPEALLSRCTSELRGDSLQKLTDERRKEIEGANQGMAGRALRVLAFACREHEGDPDTVEEKELTFVGLAGLIDPPRDEARDAIAICRSAGIRPVMITGDHPATAIAIARELGLAGKEDKALTGAELDRIDNGELAARIEGTPVFARVTAEHKLQIIRAWKKRGQVVAMTGDGVNDAPAVKAADIGVAMGITGTDVTKEASSMVLMDDNFATIVSAVEEGRSIYDNIRNVLAYLLSCNAGEILLMLGASILGWPVPLLPIQLLWINLVTDSLPALALSVEPPEPGVMDRPPRLVGVSILAGGIGWIIILQGVMIAAIVLTTFHLFGSDDEEHLARARSAAFCVLVFSELFRALAARNLKLTAFQIGIFSNRWLVVAISASALLQIAIMTIPPVRSIFGGVEHTAREWMIIGGMAFIDITIIEVAKIVLRIVSGKEADTLTHHSGKR